MATVFWDSHGVILIDYLINGKPLTRAYYASLLDKLKAELAEKRPHLQEKKILFHQDNTHQAWIVVGRLEGGQTQAKVAQAIGVSRSVISRICYRFWRLEVQTEEQDKVVERQQRPMKIVS
ncbi:histonelysine Nmethyltransferase SETMARlike [Trichonephila clavipes]|nr:histonelysine Nmethyltransferase SETMARlike [Trichonephila clavipes]